MLSLSSITISDVSQTLLNVLLHSIWQVAMIALIVAGVLRFIPAKRTNVRYSVAVSALALVVLVSLATWSILRLDSPTQTAARPVDAAPSITIRNASGSNPATVHPSTPLAAGSSVTDIAPWIIGLWAIGCIVMLFRAFRGMAEVRLLMAEPTSSADESGTLESLRTELSAVCHLLGMRTSVTLQRCSNIASPAVVGLLWPVILVPAAMLSSNTLTREEWRIVLAHELAHVRRFDGLVNLAQLLIESILFFNPSVWWLSREIRVEREACCDAVAATVVGQPLTVARTLLNVAETMSHSVRTSANAGQRPVPALAFADSTEPGSIRDRVSRLAAPDLAPRSRGTWIGFTWLSLVLSIVMLVGTAVALQKSTDVAVRSAAAMLTPQDRVNELARLQAENTGVYAPTSRGDALPTDPAAFPTGKVSVHVVVKTADGSPIPNGLSVVAGLRRPGSSAAITIANKNKSVPSLELDREFEFGSLKVAASAIGFAPAVSERLTLRPDIAAPAIELILTKGFQQTVRIEDPNGKPVSGVQIGVRGLLRVQGMQLGLTFADTNAIANKGELQLENLSERTAYEFTVDSPGWEYKQAILPIQQGQPAILQVRRATPTTMKIVDDEKGAAVEGARVIVAGWNNRSNVSAPNPHMGDQRVLSDADNTWTVGKSDSQGVAMIDKLNRDMKYLLLIQADGYQPEYVQPIQPGVAASTVRLSRAIVFEGQIVGDLSKLPSRKHNGKNIRRLKYRNDLRISAQSSYSGLLSVPLDDDGRFRIDNLISGGMRFSLPSGEVKMSTDKSRDRIVLDLAALAEANKAHAVQLPTRKVVAKLSGLKDSAMIRGSVEFQWRENERNKSKTVAVIDCSATTDIPIGAWFSVREQGLVGCTFDELRNVEVAEGSGHQSVDIPANPAGGVFGTVLRADGTPASAASVTVIEIETPPSGRLDANPSVRGNADSFFRTIPFGGRYAVLAREFNQDHTVWAVSDSFLIDADNPIQELKLTLGSGQPTTIRVVDQDGKPVVNAEVDLSISHAGASSNSQSIASLTDENGIANMGLVQVRGDSGETRQRISADVKPSKSHAGWRDFLDNTDNAFTIQIESGVTASGVVIDVNSGAPIPNITVAAFPADYDSTNYHGHLRTRTDANGRFTFHGMHSIRYRVSTPDAAPAEAVVTKLPNGSRHYEYPNGSIEQIVVGGNEESHEIQAQIVE